MLNKNILYDNEYLDEYLFEDFNNINSNNNFIDNNEILIESDNNLEFIDEGIPFKLIGNGIKKYGGKVLDAGKWAWRLDGEKGAVDAANHLLKKGAEKTNVVGKISRGIQHGLNTSDKWGNTVRSTIQKGIQRVGNSKVGQMYQAANKTTAGKVAFGAAKLPFKIADGFLKYLIGIDVRSPIKSTIHTMDFMMVKFPIRCLHPIRVIRTHAKNIMDAKKAHGILSTAFLGVAGGAAMDTYFVGSHIKENTIPTIQQQFNKFTKNAEYEMNTPEFKAFAHSQALQNAQPELKEIYNYSLQIKAANLDAAGIKHPETIEKFAEWVLYQEWKKTPECQEIVKIMNSNNYKNVDEFTPYKNIGR